MRGAVLALLLCVVGCGESGTNPPEGEGGAGGMETVDPPAPDPVSFRETASMATARANHTATLLPNGAVIVIGGETIQRDMLDSVEIFDPASETWTAGPALPAPRANHVAVALGDGRVLIAGGGRSAPIGQPSGNEVLASALLYDPEVNGFSETGSLLEGRSHFGAVLLADGTVLVAGGGAGTHVHGSTCNGVPNCGPLADGLASAEIYDPASGTWSAAGPMMQARYSFTLTALASGGAIAVGGLDHDKTSFATTELFAGGVFSSGPSLVGPDREHHGAALLGSGGVLVAGGKRANIGMIDAVEVFHPDSGQWTAAAPLPDASTVPGLVSLESGRVLRVGGYSQPLQSTLDTAAIFDEATLGWQPMGPLHAARSNHSLTLLQNGAVLVAGGFVVYESASCEISE